MKDSDQTPTESQIEGEHEKAYKILSIPIQYWGAAGFSSVNENWIGSTASTQEMSNLSNLYFDELSSSVVTQNLNYVFAAGFIANFAIFGNYFFNVFNFENQDYSDDNMLKQLYQDIHGVPDLAEVFPKTTYYTFAENVGKELSSLYQASEGSFSFFPVLGLISSDLGGQNLATANTSSGPVPGAHVVGSISTNNLDINIDGTSVFVDFFLGSQRWLAKFEHRFKWNICLNSAIMPGNRRDDDEAYPP